MLTTVVMPSMGASMEYGTILAWLVQEGESVGPGTVLCELETDKATVEFESPVGGTVLRLVARPGEAVAVGEPIAFIGNAGEEIPPPPD